jgi:hypothetical protein
LNMSFGVFVRTLINDYGWTTSMVSLTYSIVTVQVLARIMPRGA